MKRFFSVIALSLIAMVACETSNQEEPKPEQTTFVVEDTNLEISSEAGVHIIKFTLSNLEEIDKVQATTEAAWINKVEVTTAGIAINVTANESVFLPRTAEVKVAFEETNYVVNVNQAANTPKVDIEFEAKALNGKYYGTSYSPGYNYFVILSEKGTTGETDLYLDTYYRLDLFSNIAAGEVLTLPVGVYEFDYLDEGMPGTIGNAYSLRFQTFEDGSYTENYIEEGALVVTENRIEAYLKFDDKKWHHIVYEGSLELGWLEIPEPDYYSTLTEDYSFNHTGGVIRFFHYGDYYGVGASNWTLTVMLSGEPLNGDYIMVDFTADSVSTTVNPDDTIGTYTCVADEASVAKNTFIAGTMSGNSYLYSWLQYVEDNYIDHSRRAPMVDGQVTIAKEGTGYIVTFDCVDDLGHTIKGTFSCPTVEIYDRQDQ